MWRKPTGIWSLPQTQCCPHWDLPGSLSPGYHSGDGGFFGLGRGKRLDRTGEDDDTVSAYRCFSLKNSTSAWVRLQGFNLHSRPNLILGPHRTKQTLFSNKEKNPSSASAQFATQLEHVLKSTVPGISSCPLARDSCAP